MTAMTGGARRLRPPSWRDPRLLVGLLLVLVSVVAGARVVSAADRTVPVYVARTALPAGSALAADSLAVARLRLTGSQARYLSAGAAPPAGLVLSRTVGAGELVPLAALVPATALAARPVTVPVGGPIPAGVAVGGRVDLWAVPEGAVSPDGARAPGGQAAGGQAAGGQAAGQTVEGGSAEQRPRRIAAGVEVYHLLTPESSGLGAGRDSAVQVLVPQGQLTPVLAALGGDATVVLLPVPGSAG